MVINFFVNTLEKFQFRHVTYCSIELKDITGIGEIVGHIKDFCLAMVDHYISRKNRELEYKEKEVEVIRKKIEIVREILQLEKDYKKDDFDFKMLYKDLYKTDEDFDSYKDGGDNKRNNKLLK